MGTMSTSIADISSRDAIRAVARHREAFRVEILPYMSDEDLTAEMAYLHKYIVSIRAGVPHVYRLAELTARLRACRHEAVIVRGWDAMDERVRWEKSA